MKTKISFLAALILLQVFVYGQTNPILNYLPENASMILRLSPKHMAGKITTADFQESMIYKALTKDKGKLDSLGLFGNVSHSGIDFASDLFFVQRGQTEGKKAKEMMVIGRLKDEAGFQDLVKKFFQKDSINLYGTNKILFKSPLYLFWNPDVFVLMLNKSVPDFGADTLSGREKIKAMNRARKEERERCFALLTPHTDNSYLADTRFTAMIGTGADISIWNGGGSMAIDEKNPLFQFAKIRGMKKQKGYSLVNFDNGEISIHTRNFPNDTMAALLEKYPSPPQNFELVYRLPANTVGFFNASYNPTLGKELAKNMDLLKLTDSMKRMLQFDPSQYSNAFKNNVLVSFLKPDSIATTDSGKKAFPIGYLIAIPIADQSKFEGLKNKVLLIWDSLQQKKEGLGFLSGFKPYAKFNDQYLVIAHSAEIASAYLNEPIKPVDTAWLATYGKYPVYGQLHFRDMISLVVNAVGGGKAKKGIGEAQPFLDLFSNIIISSGLYENNSLNSFVEMKMPDGSKNSLKQLFDAVNNLMSQGQKKE